MCPASDKAGDDWRGGLQGWDLLGRGQAFEQRLLLKQLATYTALHSIIYDIHNIPIYANGSSASCTPNPCKKKSWLELEAGPAADDACRMLEVQCKDVCIVQNCSSYC